MRKIFLRRHRGPGPPCVGAGVFLVKECNATCFHVDLISWCCIYTFMAMAILLFITLTTCVEKTQTHTLWRKCPRKHFLHKVCACAFSNTGGIMVADWWLD